jgi:hypothetical protein
LLIPRSSVDSSQTNVGVPVVIYALFVGLIRIGVVGSMLSTTDKVTIGVCEYVGPGPSVERVSAIAFRGLNTNMLERKSAKSNFFTLFIVGNNLLFGTYLVVKLF